jgi:hypothetical protein
MHPLPIRSFSRRPSSGLAGLLALALLASHAGPAGAQESSETAQPEAARPAAGSEPAKPQETSPPGTTAPQLPAPETTVMEPDGAAPEKTASRRHRGQRKRADELPRAMGVSVQNRSKPTLCAEDDNVYLTFNGGNVRHFRVDARPPAVIGSIVVDSTAPDFTDCTIADQPPGPEDKVERIVLFEDDTMQLVGYRHAAFWRKGDVPLRVGDREEHALHLVQLFAKTPKGPYEYLVMYPLDGYWRARPLPPARLEQVAYGTSFLVGMVEEHERPVVAIKAIKFVPAVKSFELTYPKGDVATVRVTAATEKATSVEVVFEKPVANGRPFAALRSMYITDVNADASHVFWKEPRGKGWDQRSVTDFRRAFASEIRLGRVAVSRHNTSAPDTVVYDFMPD